MDTQPTPQPTPERVCPACGSTHRQIKAGKTGAGKPRLPCQDCKRHYVLNPQPRGLDPSLRRMAIRLYLEGNGFRRIARLLGVNPQTVVNWVRAEGETYRFLIYPKRNAHQVAPGKSQTHNVEGVNADLRHYLARLTRRSRCFTRSQEALRCAVRLFQCAYNRRQLLKHDKKLQHVPGLCDCLPISV